LRSRSDPAELVLAMRGSDQGIVEGADGTANVGNFLDGVAREQIVDMLNFYRRLVSDTEVTQYRYDRVALPIWDAAPGPHYELLDVIDTVAIYGVLSEKDVTASGLGVGGQVMSYAVAEVTRRGGDRIFLAVDDRNAAAMLCCSRR